MPAETEQEHRPALIGITALVKPWDGVQRIFGSASESEQSDRGTPAQSADDPDRLHVSVRLTALIEGAEPVPSGRDDFGISMPRRGLGPIWHRDRAHRLKNGPAEEAGYVIDIGDLHDAINQMLGRDPAQHRPPRLCWGHLLAALADMGLLVAEQELIDAPLTVALSPEVNAQIADAQA